MPLAAYNLIIRNLFIKDVDIIVNKWYICNAIIKKIKYKLNLEEKYMFSTISTVLTMCVLDSLIALVLCILARSGRFIRKVGPQCMITLSLMVIIRMFIPVEFTFTYNIRIEDVLTKQRRFFDKVLFTKPFEITVWYVIIFVWIVVAVGIVVYKIREYYCIMRCIAICPVEQWDDIAKKYDFDADRYSGIRNIRIICNKQFKSPCIMGLNHPYLLLPDINYGKEEFRYIILHEYMHMKHKDIACKLIIDLLCTICWWNPIFYFMKKELFQMIEMRNDMKICEVLSEEEKIGYMECLKNTAFQLVGRDKQFAVAFSKKDFRELKNRMKLIAYVDNFKKGIQVAAVTIMSVLLIMTSLIVFEPCSDDAPEGISITNENGFLVKNGEQYDVYVEGEYLFTTDDLRPFYHMEIYKNIQEAEKNEKTKLH